MDFNSIDQTRNSSKTMCSTECSRRGAALHFLPSESIVCPPNPHRFQSTRVYELPIRMPARNTNAPPTTTWIAEENSGVSI